MLVMGKLGFSKVILLQLTLPEMNKSYYSNSALPVIALNHYLLKL